jgi:M6 family metalloprotease-like protein
LDVVLVTFRDETTATAGAKCLYCNHDRPYGDNPGESSVHADSSYTRRDFERLFSGGYDGLPDFVGTTQTVGAGHILPEVFGSVQAYYDSMSLDPKDRAKGITKGKFQLHVRLINPDDGTGYPRWIELPQTKATYANLSSEEAKEKNSFWNDAYNAAWNAVQCWNPHLDDPKNVTCGASNLSGYDIKDLPNSDSEDFPWQRLVRRKVAYLYSGATFTNQKSIHLLHPQADMTTLASPKDKTDVGYRYVMGEREGFGNNNHTIDEFAGIGLHVHEIGHLLGLNHGEGEWTPDNDDEASTSSNTTTTKGANFVGWGLMQGGREGPVRVDTTEAKDLSRAYSSCPVPINPFYRMDLGWLEPTAITKSTTDYALALGSVHLIDVGKRFVVTPQETTRDTLLLERRSNNGFGRYISFYEYKDQDPGLLIWRRGKQKRPILIVADRRRIRDARDQVAHFQVPEYQDQLSDPFPGAAAVNAVYATTGAVGLRQQTSGSFAHPDPGNLGVALTNIRRGKDKDALTVDIHLNYWAGDIAPYSSAVTPTREVWGDGVPSWDTGTIYVAGDVTVRDSLHKARLTIARGTEVRFLAKTDATSGGTDPTRSELIVEGELTVEEASDVSDGGVTFRSATTVDPSNDDWYGIRVASGGTATLSDATIRDGSRCVQDEGGTLTMTNTTLTNCGATVTLNPTLPYVDRKITATLENSAVSMTDPKWQWQWQRRRSTDAWTNIPSAEDSAYTPTASDIGFQLRATVRYQAETDVYPHARSGATASVAGVPGASPHITASPGAGQVVVVWDAAPANGSPITRYEVQWRVAASGHGWPGWSAVAGGGTARDTTATGLLNGTQYELAVRAVNGVGAGASVSVTATPQAWSGQVSFGSVSYQATEGGAGVSIPVSLSPAPSQPVRLPVVVSADTGTEAGDYAVPGLTKGTVWVSFGAGVSSQSFTITANEDADSADETVSLSFGSLPAGVVAVGTTRQATVRLLDDDADTQPVFSPSGGAKESIVGQYFSFTRPSATGGNGSLTYSVSGSCAGLTVTSSSVSGKPSSSGQCGIRWTATDADGDTDAYALQLSVAADTAPAFASSGGSRSAIVGHSFSFTRPSASGGNGSLTYSVSGSCSGLTVTASSVSGKPSSTGQCGIRWTVRDADGDTDAYALQLSVYSPGV